MKSTIFSNLVAVLDLWTRHQTGYLRLRSLGGNAARDTVIEVVNGGLVHAHDWSLLLSRLPDHVFSFDLVTVNGRGDRRAMGGLISTACRRHGINLDDALEWTGGEPTLATLPTPGSFLSLLPGLALPSDLDLDLPGTVSNADDIQNAMLAQGIARIGLDDWEGADEVLSVARDQRFDSPRTLAWLAWARINNPSRAAHERMADALSLIQVAEQLAPQDAEVSARARAIRHELNRGRARRATETSALAAS